ncbi:N-acetylglucosamine-6-phosphate deacetylase [Flexivirga endophytica]|uniref:N-acetylglucosamine-6-phosphate deacetylase n=1 Tax=Flexivirga endophytica TaxID=1849103 RepID=A0A916SWL6_9MICO|nr:N-acetylglucosamine-6-phosphate deacetylase [Flexivirga endophytica]GGB19759.1 N-acetylglucosamine-6-phosphate deacetylase [Flexivirga endophytica]GHB35958.1 N-acetylglucosamine-6-phosphate deacetylase [Flexivirga endophytica]
MTDSLLADARLLTPDGIVDGGLRITDGRISAVQAADGDGESLGGALVVPGFVDIHVHGGGGHDMSASAQDMAEAVRFHRGHGTTTSLVSLVTAPVDALCEQLRWAAALAEAGEIAGAHLEGPFLSHVRCGAQNPDHLLEPDLDAFERMVDAAGSHLRVITIAPELPGALELVDAAVRAGVVAAVGHTDATYDQARAAFDHGATLATHLFNGMRPIHHREPGPVLASLDAGVPCETINDGIHLHPAVLREVLARGTDRLVLITDAIDATGVGDGEYVLGGQQVWVRDGAARLENGSLAGSSLTMDSAFARAVRDGVDLQDASAAASANPAQVIGLADRGVIAPGARADLVVLGEDHTVQRVMRAGAWTDTAQ